MEATRKDLETIIYGVKLKDGTNLPGLEYVRVEPGRLVATDGRVLIVRELEHNGKDFESFSISVADVKGAIRSNAELWKTNGHSVKIDPGDEFMAKIGRKTVVKQDTGYVEWTRALKGAQKNSKGFQKACFDPAVLMKGLQGMKDIEKVELRLWDESKAVRLDGQTADGRKVLTLVMPIVRK